MACDPSPQDAQALTDNREAYSLETATLITQSLVARLFALPGRLAAFGRVVDLPGPAFQLPRQKPLPTARPPTRQGSSDCPSGQQGACKAVSPHVATTITTGIRMRTSSPSPIHVLIPVQVGEICPAEGHSEEEAEREGVG